MKDFKQYCNEAKSSDIAIIDDIHGQAGFLSVWKAAKKMGLNITASEGNILTIVDEVVGKHAVMEFNPQFDDDKLWNQINRAFKKFSIYVNTIDEPHMAVLSRNELTWEETEEALFPGNGRAGIGKRPADIAYRKVIKVLAPVIDKGEFDDITGSPAVFLDAKDGSSYRIELRLLDLSPADINKVKSILNNVKDLKYVKRQWQGKIRNIWYHKTLTYSDTSQPIEFRTCLLIIL